MFLLLKLWAAWPYMYAISVFGKVTNEAVKIILLQKHHLSASKE